MSPITKIIDWLCDQNYTRTQLENVTRAQMRIIAENRGLTEKQIKRLAGSYHTILLAVWSDWREKRIDAARVILEAKVHEYDADGTVRYKGYEPSSVDPNNRVSVFTVEVNLELERN